MNELMFSIQTGLIFFYIGTKLDLKLAPKDTYLSLLKYVEQYVEPCHLDKTYLGDEVLP